MLVVVPYERTTQAERGTEGEIRNHIANVRRLHQGPVSMSIKEYGEIGCIHVRSTSSSEGSLHLSTGLGLHVRENNGH